MSGGIILGDLANTSPIPTEFQPLAERAFAPMAHTLSVCSMSLHVDVSACMLVRVHCVYV